MLAMATPEIVFTIIFVAMGLFLSTAIVLGVRHANACERETKEFKRLGVRFADLPQELKDIVRAAALAQEWAIPESMKAVVVADLSKSPRKWTCDVCGAKLTGWAALFKMYGSRSSVCLDQAPCLRRAETIRHNHLVAAAPLHKEAVDIVKSLAEPRDEPFPEKAD